MIEAAIAQAMRGQGTGRDTVRFGAGAATLVCELARGPDADRRAKPLMNLVTEGSLFGAYSQFVDEIVGAPNVRLHCDDEHGGKFLDLAAAIASAPAAAHFYCCGPAPMLAAFEAATAHLPPAQVHVEYFTAKEEKNLAGGYTLQLARSNREFTIPPGRSILQVLQDAGIDIPYSCEQGICGSCETRVLVGEPDHRDAILTDEERAGNKTTMICCSGSKGDKLVLDI